MKISVELPVTQPDAIQTCAPAIEDAGFDACFATDRPAPSPEWMAHGGHQTLDPFVALSFAASATTKLKLHTNCLVRVSGAVGVGESDCDPRCDVARRGGGGRDVVGVHLPAPTVNDFCDVVREFGVAIAGRMP
jgi:hypothetical protein